MNQWPQVKTIGLTLFAAVFGAQACCIPRLIHGNGIPMGIPWETSHGMAWDSTPLYFP